MRQTRLVQEKKKKKRKKTKPISSTLMAIYNLKKSIGEKYGNTCFICGIKHTARRQLVIHHLWYMQGEKTYKDFRKRIDYLNYLKERTNETPDRFILVCNKHHQIIERLKRFNDNNFALLVDAVRRSTRT